MARLTSMNRTVAVLVHPQRPEALAAATGFIDAISESPFEILVFPEDVDRLHQTNPHARLRPIQADDSAELAVVFGGDGTILRAAEWAVPLGVPLLGVNLGHVGFLAELETSDVAALPRAVLERAYTVEQRLVLRVRVDHADGSAPWTSFAVNEVSLEKAAREKMLGVALSIDDRELSQWGCDGVLVASPSGSTAYAFSAGGPVVWPDVQAMLVVPLSAHALFNRPMVIAPDSTVTLQLTREFPGLIWCDGRRSTDLVAGDVVHVGSLDQPLHIARLSPQPFTSRLVRKFNLPVQGWGRGRTDAH